MQPARQSARSPALPPLAWLIGVALLLVASVLDATLGHGFRTAPAEKESLPAREHERQGSALPPHRRASFGAFGHSKAAADLVWLGVVQEVGASTRASPELFESLVNNLERIIKLDPRYFTPQYTVSTFLLSYGAPEALREKVLAWGLDTQPQRWESHFLYGWDLFFLQDQPLEAAGFWRQAAQRPGAPAYLASAAARLISFEGGSTEAVGFLQELLQRLPEGRARDLAQERLQIELSEEILAAYDAACRARLAETGSLPASPEALFEAVEVDAPPFDRLGNAIYFDPEKTCVARTDLVSVRRFEARERSRRVGQKRLHLSDADRAVEGQNQ